MKPIQQKFTSGHCDDVAGTIGFRGDRPIRRLRSEYVTCETCALYLARRSEQHPKLVGILAVNTHSHSSGRFTFSRVEQIVENDSMTRSNTPEANLSQSKHRKGSHLYCRTVPRVPNCCDDQRHTPCHTNRLAVGHRTSGLCSGPSHSNVRHVIQRYPRAHHWRLTVVAPPGNAGHKQRGVNPPSIVYRVDPFRTRLGGYRTARHPSHGLRLLRAVVYRLRNSAIKLAKIPAPRFPREIC